MISAKKLTVDDYRKLGEGAPYTLEDGIFVNEPSPEYGHQSASGSLFNQIANYINVIKCGIALAAPMDVYFDKHNVLQPDILYVKNENKHRIHRDGIHGPPDMIIEILSPGTAQRDLKNKKNIYERFGVQEYWIIDPDTTEITGYCLKKGKFVELFTGKGKFFSEVLQLELTVNPPLL